MDNNFGLDSLLKPFRVLDLTDENGYFCAKILGDLGAEVTRIEKPETERNSWWWSYNSGKNIIHLDIENEKEKVIQLAKESDFLIESFSPGFLDRIDLGYSVMKRANPKLIFTSISPYGKTGPYKDYKASDLELMAMSGIMYVLGDADRPPVRITLPQAFLLASAKAAMGTLIAHHWRERTGEGQHVDVSAQESLFDVLMQAPYYYKWFGDNPSRTGKYRLGVSGGIFLHPMIWECKDGHVSFMMQGGKLGAYNNKTITRYIGMDGDLPERLKTLEWETLNMAEMNPEKMEEIWGPFKRFFAHHSVQEIYQMALKERFQLFPVNTVEDVLDDEQLEAREFWQEQEIPELGRSLKLPGPFSRITFPASSDNQEDSPDKKERPEKLPFEGLKIADFSWVAAGPWITTWLEGYGAEVIKIESNNRLDATRVSGPFLDNKPGPARSGMFLVFNGAKKSLTLNLNTDGGKKLAKKLVQWADVVVESYAPGQMHKWGLNYEELRKINPNIIMLSASMMGATGPHSAQPGLGLQLTSLTGFSYLTGWPDRDPPFIWGAYTDIPASRLGAATLLAVLDHYRRTGKACYIDLSQYEASTQCLAPLLLDFQVTGNIMRREGNRSPEAAPHGAFPCRGKDRWCVLSVFNEKEWNSLCKVMGIPGFAEDPRFATFEKRKENEDELERCIADWTRQFTPEKVMKRLQKAGVNAGVVQTSEDVLNDPQLKHRNHYLPLTHPEMGDYDYFCPGFRLEKVPIRPGIAPCLGEHNKYICTQILGLSDEEFNDYITSGVLK